ncbi:restriction endonuclease subunit S [Butyrivibrio sp. INlla14]|uniref:restriction endonuclease subunit S n=1 Tax=Butyrivibrio sp. INlla14 TaxID=1520808 RepID=UPI0008768F64|nr:restriction endonuclease subunit S [Butyrivibrio sp. INlla14]SCY63094.1 type I restriction enzyme, S subunit [Butyrivibrio sp. INlla14]
MEKVRLGDVASYVNGYAFKPEDWSDNGLEIIRIQNLTGNAYEINKYDGEYDPKYEVNTGDVLISWSASLGVYVWTKEKAVLNQHIFKVVFDKMDVDKDFFVYQVNGILNKAESETHGATMRHLTKPVFDNLPFVLPTIDEQTVIANKLKKIEKIIDSRKEQLEQLDTLIKARFVEMFGNLQCNDKHWNEKTLGDVCCKVIRYPTFYGMDYLAEGTRVIRIGNILEDGHMDLDDANYAFVYDGVNEDFPETVIEENDIIMAVRGDGSAAKRIGLVTEKKLIGSNISPNLIRIKVDDMFLNPLFMFFYMTGEVGQTRLDAYVNKTAKKNIAAKDIVKVITPVPPLGLQNEFAEFVAQVNKSKVVNIKGYHYMEDVA